MSTAYLVQPLLQFQMEKGLAACHDQEQTNQLLEQHVPGHNPCLR